MGESQLEFSKRIDKKGDDSATNGAGAVFFEAGACRAGIRAYEPVHARHESLIRGCAGRGVQSGTPLH